MWPRVVDGPCGMVCSPPIGSRAGGFGAEVETAFLNGYQARWQLAASAIGLGFAQGKVMFFRRDLLAQAGGIAALATEPAEDAAATKVVRAAGLHVRVVGSPFAQPLGTRRLIDVWKRQLRWALLRRATFPACFYPEIATSPMLPCTLLALATGPAGVPAVLVYLALWYGAEMAFTSQHGWNLSRRSLAACVLRDCLLPFIWVLAIFKNKFEWQGHAMDSNALRKTAPQPSVSSG
jgi:ceramide glucosyltransferase